MANTTNYSWETPDDTDLVKDGAAAIRTLGTAIDTTVFNNASAAIAKTIVDAKGDIIAATAADTVARLAVGANDTVLTADSSTATGLKWAAPASGGMTLLSTTTLSGASTTISGISGSYNDLQIIIHSVTNATGTGQFSCSPNGDGTITNALATADYTTNVGGSGTTLKLSGDATTTRPAFDNSSNTWMLKIFNYASTTTRKPFIGSATFIGGTTTNRGFYTMGGINTSSAITSLKFENSGGNFNGGTVLIYGVK